MSDARSGAKLRFGLDVGSTTVKLVAVEHESGELVFSRYVRHHAALAETAAALLHEAADELGDAAADGTLPLAICGSGGRPLAEALGVPYIQEVVANAEAISRLLPQARCAIELGGQDAKVLFFETDPATGKTRADDMRMNGSCAGGTGAFLDEIAKLMNVEPEHFDELAAAGTRTYDISGRCGVFAKTDIQPLLSQGATREDICLSTLHAITKQVIGGLAQGLELKPPIVFEGGPLTYNPTLVRVFAERLGLSGDDIIVPQHPETLVARGAALAHDAWSEKLRAGTAHAGAAGGRDGVRSLSEAAARLDALAGAPAQRAGSRERPLFAGDDEARAFLERHEAELRELDAPGVAAGSPDAPTALRVYLGIDSGSTTSKFVLLDEDARIVDRFYAHNDGEPLAVLRRGLLDAQGRWHERGYELDVVAMGCTGYGEQLVARAFGADVHMVETVAHAKGCLAYVPDASFILDIGGQDMKAIWLADGIVTDIMLNEACSSGCGSFLENFATGLGVSAPDIAAAAFRSTAPAKLGSRCTVFMTSSVVNAQREGSGTDDILAGLSRSIIENVFTKVVRVGNFDVLGERIVVQGGTFKNMAVLRALEEYLGRDVTLAPYPGEMGALGAGLLAREHARAQGADAASTFIGFDGLRGFGMSTKDGIRCTGCGNGCALTLTRFSNGRTWVSGNRCERGAAEGGTTVAEAPDVFAMREQLLMQPYEYTPVAEERGVTVGIPRVLEFWDSMPFWTTFLTALGYTPVISHASSHELFEAGLAHVASDTVCLPAKLVHGHIRDLAEQGVDRVFFPHVMHMPPEGLDKKAPYACSIIMGYPAVVGNFQPPDTLYGVRYDNPVFHWFSEQDRHSQICAWACEALDASEQQVQDAYEQAERAILQFRTELESRAAAVIAETRERGGFCMVLAGRPYHTDPYLSHDISRRFALAGVPVIPVDALPGIRDVDLSHTRIEVTNNFHARMLAGAYLAAADPALEYTQIVSFGCGHDAVLTDEVTRILDEVGGKHPLVLKVDESEASGSLGIRIQSFIQTLGARRAAGRDMMPGGPRELPDAYPAKFRKEDKQRRTVIVPNISHEVSVLFDGLLRREGFTPQLVDVGGLDQMKLGKRYTHNDICFPCQMVIGEAIDALRAGGWQDRQDEVAVGMVKFQCDCRLSHYGALLRKALDAAGFPDVAVLTTDGGDSKDMHPGTMLLEPRVIISALWAFMMLDILTDLKRKIRPYELVDGATQKLYDESIEAISRGLQHGLREAVHAFEQAIDAFAKLPYDRSTLKPRVLVTGELLVTYHPGSNFHIEDYLESCGMETVFPRVTSQLRKDFLAQAAQRRDFHADVDASGILVGKLFDIAQSTMERIARRHPLFTPEPSPEAMYEGVSDMIPKTLSCGEGWLMAAEIAHYARQGVHSFVILQPFGCLPNHVCGRGMTKRLKDELPGIQILPLDLDPDTSFANVENRLQMLVMNDSAQHDDADTRAA